MSVFQLTNNGHSKTQSTTVKIFWPSYTELFSNLLYLVEEPRVLRGDKSCCNGKCQASSHINPDKLNVCISNTLMNTMNQAQY